MSIRKRINKLLIPLGVKLTKFRDETYIAAVPLSDIHLKNCKVLPNRESILNYMPKHCRICEVGVLFGDYTIKLLNVLEPQECVAIDLYDRHECSQINGKSPKLYFGEKTHDKFVEDRLSESISKGVTKIMKEFSDQALMSFPDQYFDFIYLDAAHDIESVKKDVECCKRKIKKDGWLVFNDYVRGDFLEARSYGVIPAVNELCVSEGWEIGYMSISPSMNCDVALRKLQ